MGVKIPFIVPLFAMVFFISSGWLAIKVEFLLLAKNLHLDSCRPDEFFNHANNAHLHKSRPTKYAKKPYYVMTKSVLFWGFKKGYPHLDSVISEKSQLWLADFEILLTGHFLTSRYFILGIGLWYKHIRIVPLQP